MSPASNVKKYIYPKSYLKEHSWFDCKYRILDTATISHKDHCDSLYFHKIVLKKCYTCLKDTPNSPPLWFNVVPSPEKLCQAVVVINDQANLQPKLNKGAGDASVTIFVTDCLEN